jgi:hypothetical protein
MAVLDPLESMAFSLYQNKGADALLLGSGVSRSAGIPSGWDIVLDLVRRVAVMKGEEVGADAAGWYHTHYGEPPRYDKLVDEVAKTRDERANLIRGYIEPTEEDRENGRKVPQSAHHAVAQLVRLGYVKVIVTPNFDRLVETALEEAGVTPDVLSTPDQVAGARPLHQAQVVVLKVNGDYLDTRIRNTEPELAEYEPEVGRYLDRVFDEYGLIVCGWSADYDVALSKALYRASSRRYMTYWAAYQGHLRDEAERLVRHRQGQVVPIDSADALFVQLAAKVQSLEAARAPHLLSVAAAVALAKRLMERGNSIQLHDLVTGETEAVRASMDSDEFPVSSPQRSGVAAQWVSQRDRYTSITEKLARITSAVAFFSGSGSTERVITSTVERLAEMPSESRHAPLLALRLYPALRVTYAAGISALAAANWRHLRAVLADPIMVEQEGRAPALTKLVAPNILKKEGFEASAPAEYGQRRTPWSDYLFDTLRDTIRTIISSDPRYTLAFDRFEYFLCLVYQDLNPEQTWAPPGAFGWRRGSQSAIDELHAELENTDESSPILKSGLFGGSVERLRSALERQRTFAARWREICGLSR